MVLHSFDIQRTSKSSEETFEKNYIINAIRTKTCLEIPILLVQVGSKNFWWLITVFLHNCIYKNKMRLQHIHNSKYMLTTVKIWNQKNFWIHSPQHLLPNIHWCKCLQCILQVLTFSNASLNFLLIFILLISAKIIQGKLQWILALQITTDRKLGKMYHIINIVVFIQSICSILTQIHFSCTSNST